LNLNVSELPGAFADFSGIDLSLEIPTGSGGEFELFDIDFDTNLLSVDIGTGKLGVFDMLELEGPLGFSMDAGSLSLGSLAGDLFGDMPGLDILSYGLEAIQDFGLSISLTPFGLNITGLLELPDVDICIGDFVHLKGNMSVELDSSYLVNLATHFPSNVTGAIDDLVVDPLLDQLDIIPEIIRPDLSDDLAVFNNWNVQALKFGASDVSAFIGLGDPDFSTPLEDQDGILGFGVQNLNVGFGVFRSDDQYGMTDPPTMYALKAMADSFGVYGFGDWFSVEGKDILVNVNTGDKWVDSLNIKPAIDFSSSFPAKDDSPAGLEIKTGGNPVYLDFDGEERIGLEVGDATVSVFDFVHVNGSFAFEKGPSMPVTIDTGVSADLAGESGIPETIAGVEVSSMTVGASNVNAFVGLNGPYYEDTNNDGIINELDDVNSDAVGFAIEDFDFGMAIFKPTVFDMFPEAMREHSPSFTALKATADKASFVGIDDVFELEFNDLEIGVNSSSITVPYTPFINFSDSFPAESGDTDGDGKANEPIGFEVKTGGDPLYLDFDSEMLMAKTSLAKLKIADFVHLRGSFAFVKGPTETVTVQTGALSDTLGSTMEHEVDVMTIGASNVYGFAGLNGPYRDDTNNDGVINNADDVNDDAFGLSLENLDLGVMIMTPSALPMGMDFTKYIAVKATAETAQVVGLDEDILTMKAYDLEVGVNISSSPLNTHPVFAILPKPAVDFKASFESSKGAYDGFYAVETGNDEEPVNMDFDSEVIQVKVGYLEIEVAGVIQLTGSGAFVKGPTREITLTDGSKKSVSIMTLGLNDVYGFAGIDGPYWTDSNGDGRIDESDSTDSDAIGLALEDVDAGLMFMQTISLSNPSMYYAGKMTVKSMELVGIDGITAGGNDLEVDFNLGGSLLGGLAVVDFSQFEDGHYAVETGNEAEPVLLDFDKMMIRASGALTFHLLSTIKLDGAFEFELSTEKLLIFADAQATINILDTPIFMADALGLLVINRQGLGLKLEIDTGFDIPGVLEFDASFNLYMNTTGEEYVYEVPESLVDDVGYETVTITAGAPQLDGTEGPAGIYMVMMGHGDLSIFSAVDVHGEYYLELSEHEFELQLSGTADLFLGSGAIAGLLRIGQEGVVGALQLGISAGFGGDLFNIAGTFQLELNSTDSTQTIQTLDIADDGSVVGFKQGTINPYTCRLMVGGTLTVFYVVEMKGAMELVVSDQGFEGYFDLIMDIGIGDLEFNATAAVLNTNSGPVFAFSVSTDAKLGFDDIGIDASALIEINTGNQVYAGVTANTFRIGFAGSLDLSAFEVAFEGEMSLVDDVFELKIEDASLDFFGVASLEVEGYIRSNGEFFIHAEAEFGVDMAIIQISGGIELWFGTDRVGGRLHGSVDVCIDMGFWEINETLAGIDAMIDLTKVSAAASITVTVFGISVSGDASWSWGAPPVIASQVGGTVYLHMGDRGVDRGSLYVDIINEKYTIDGKTDGQGTAIPNVIIVRALGEEMEFSGVNKIVVEGNQGNDGNDYIYVGQYVDAELDFNLGTGDDTVILLDGGAGSTIDVGAGDDQVITRIGEPISKIVGGKMQQLEPQEGPNYYYLGSGDDLFDGEAGHDYVHATSGNNTITTRDGNDTVIVDAGNNFISTGDGADEITVNFGTGTIHAGEGNDIVNMLANTYEINASGGDDIININTEEGEYTVTGGEGLDRTILKPFASDQGEKLYLSDHRFKYKRLIVNVHDSLELLEVTDTSSETILKSVTPGGDDWGAAGLFIDATGSIDMNDASFISPEGQLILYAGNGIDGTINTHIDTLTVVNNGSGDLANIIVREADSLKITANNHPQGGLYTSQGLIDVELAEKDALFIHRSGVISTQSSGKDITITADDIDLRAGPGSVIGKGELTIKGKSNALNYRIGGAAQDAFGNDYSLGSPDATMDLSMRDVAALADGFSLMTIGTYHPDSIMNVGDLRLKEFKNFLHIVVDDDGKAILTPGGEMQTYAEDLTINAKLKDNADFSAGRINVVGNAQSSEHMKMTADLLEINRANINDPMGEPDSGITSKEIIVDVTEQMIITGWIIADDKINININNTTGENALISYNDGPNSLTADKGSTINTLNSNSQITVNTAASIRSATIIEVCGTNSTIDMTAGTGLTILEGAVVTARESGSTISLSALTHLHIDPGGAVTAGAKFENINGIPTAIKTGDNTTINLNSQGEMKLSGSITSAGDINFNSKNSNYDHAEYFDTIPGVVLTSTSADANIISSLNNSVLPETIRTLLANKNLPLQNSATVTPGIIFTNFEELTKEQQIWVGEQLGYTAYEGMSYYNANAEMDKRILETFIQGPMPDYQNSDINWGSAGAPTEGTEFSNLTQQQKNAVISHLGYTEYNGPIYYNPNASDGNFIRTTFYGGKQPDYNNKDIEWGDAGAPSNNTDFVSLTQAQKEKVIAHLGYTYDPNSDTYYNFKASSEKRVLLEEDFLQGEDTEYQNDKIFWGSAGEPEADTPFDSLTDAQKKAVVKQLRYEEIIGEKVYYNPDVSSDKMFLTDFMQGTVPDYCNATLDWDGVPPPDAGTLFDSMTVAQQELILHQIGYTEFDGIVFYNAGAAEGSQFKQTFIHGKGGGADYLNTEVNWGNLPQPDEDAEFDDLTFDQQRAVADSLGYDVFYGLVYFKSTALPQNQFKMTFVENVDYTLKDVKWSEMEIPDDETLFDDLTDVQKQHIAEQLGYNVNNGILYYKADDEVNPFRTRFVQGVDYTNSDIGLSSELVNKRWLISDGTNSYLVYGSDPDGNGTFDELQIQEPHLLYGQRGFGFLLTGTITALKDDMAITVEGDADAIVRGSFNLLGSDSDLSMQSDKWVYWEGTANVTGNLKLYGGSNSMELMCLVPMMMASVFLFIQRHHCQRLKKVLIYLSEVQKIFC